MGGVKADGFAAKNVLFFEMQANTFTEHLSWSLNIARYAAASAVVDQFALIAGKINYFVFSCVIHSFNLFDFL
jgi:hypothetical protein